jgi:hypothetical protein
MQHMPGLVIRAFDFKPSCARCLHSTSIHTCCPLLLLSSSCWLHPLVLLLLVKRRAHPEPEPLLLLLLLRLCMWCCDLVRPMQAAVEPLVHHPLQQLLLIALQQLVLLPCERLAALSALQLQYILSHCFCCCCCCCRCGGVFASVCGACWVCMQQCCQQHL